MRLKEVAGVIFVAVLAGILFFPDLGAVPFYTKGEPREAVQVWDEVHRGNWVLPLRNGTEIPSKPPLFHWLGGVTALVTGSVDEFSTRFPSAMAAALTLLAVFWTTARKWGMRTAILTTVILATSFEWMRAARGARVDMVLTAALTGAFLALEAIVRAEQPTRRALLAFYGCMAAAVLSKGPIGIILPGGLAGVYLAVRRDLNRVLQMRPLMGAAIAVGIPACWYGLATLHGGQAFVQKQILNENLNRFFGEGAMATSHIHGPFYLVGTFLAGFLPWSLFIPPVVVFLYRRRKEFAVQGLLYPALWFAFVFLFYSVASSKRSVYLLSLYPAAAMLVGAWFHDVTTSGAALHGTLRRALVSLSYVLAGVVSFVGFVVLLEGAGVPLLDLLLHVLHARDQIAIPVIRRVLLAAHLPTLLWVAAVVGAIFVLAAALRRGRWVVVFSCIAVFVGATALFVNRCIHPTLAQEKSLKGFATNLRTIVGAEDELYFFRTFDYGAVFYAQRRIPVIRKGLPEEGTSGPDLYLLLFEQTWHALAPAERARLDVLARTEHPLHYRSGRLFLARAVASPADS